MLPELSDHFKIVLFDNLAWGMNQRVDNVGDALESPEKAEEWILTWWEQLIDKLTLDGYLPQKFLLSGHSAGAFQSMIYAMSHPERIESLFL